MIALRSPEETLVLVPHIVGYRPARQLVLCGLDQRVVAASGRRACMGPVVVVDCAAESVGEDHARFIADCMKKINAENDILIRGDVFRFLKSCHQKFDLIFADPPYALPELDTLPDLVFEHDLLAADGVFVFEHGKHNDFSAHPRFKEHRSYGSVNFSIFR